MALKNILVHVDGSPAGRVRLDLALALAVRDAAHLAIVHLFGWQPFPGYLVAEMPQGLIDQMRQSARERAEAVEAESRRVCDLAGVAAEWRMVETFDPTTVARHARYADLAIVGQDNPDDGQELKGIAEAVVLESGRPALVVPYAGRFETVGKTVLVAWDGGREATRAVNDMLPLLSGDARVSILALDPDRTLAGNAGTPGQDIALHLARHGVKVEASHYVTDQISVGDLLLSRAADFGSDMIVMGGYGHSRMREVVLGGTTRHLLQHMTVPVLMSH